MSSQKNKKHHTNQNKNSVISKSRIFGDKITVEELVSSLTKNLAASGNGLVLLHTCGDEPDTGEPRPLNSGILTAIYSCKSCRGIHLVAGNYKSYDNGKLFNSIYFLHAKKVYINKIHGEEMTHEGLIDKEELLSFLKSISQKTGVLVENIDEESTFALTGVSTCGNPECSSLHLLSGYQNNIVRLN